MRAQTEIPMARFHHVLTQSENGVKTITMNRPDSATRSVAAD